MNYKIGCDAHRKYSQFAILDDEGSFLQQVRINHVPGAIRDFLEDYPPGTPVALESVGNWYWIVDEIEAAGCIPLMAHAAKAKVMMGNVNKTDKLDARGLAMLLHLGSLPTVWLPPQTVRDERELHRTRMALSKQRTALKNRIHSTLAKYALSLDTDSDIFAPKWRPALAEAMHALPTQTCRCMQQQLDTLDHIQSQIHLLEERIKQKVALTRNIQLIKTLPGVAKLFERVRQRKGHAVAVGAVARHLSEAAYWLLKKGKPYRDPAFAEVSPRSGSARG